VITASHQLPTPVPTAMFREVEFHDFATDRWLANDLAELA
jgi:hypothetical protein